MGKILTNEEFLQKLADNNLDYIPLEEYKGCDVKIRFMCGKNHNHIFITTPRQLLAGANKFKEHCPYCVGHMADVGVNDLWTTHPEIASMLLNPDDGYIYKAGSNQRTDFVCPDCGKPVLDKLIPNVIKQGLSCDNCSDGISFAEKFVGEMLNQLDIDYVRDRPLPWSNNKRYDFYVEDYSLIIETHGIQHYDRAFEIRSSTRDVRTLEDEKQNDVFKYELAIENGIEKYIVLDCRESTLEYVRSSIVNSGLSIIFDLSNVDWDKCLASTFTSSAITVCNLWNSGVKNTKEISKMTKLSIGTVIEKLKQGRKIGLCDYVEHYKKNKSRYKPVLCVETGKIYESISAVKEDGYCNTHVSACCNNRKETAHGFHWRFV